MTPERVREIIEAYGADPGRWPDRERDAALAMLRRDGSLAALQREARQLDGLLDDVAPPPLRLDAADLARRVAESAQERPAGRGTGEPAIAWWQWFGWPKLAGLAVAALIGFSIGWSGLDGRLGDWAAPGTVISAPAEDGLEPLLEADWSWQL